MENSTHDACLDSSCSRQGPLRRTQTPQQAVSPTSTSSEATIRLLQIEPPAYTNVPYLDSQPSPYHDSSPASAISTFRIPCQQPLTFQIYSPTDLTHTSRPSYSDDEDDEDDENVPLAQLLLYPGDAPPAYSTVVRQSYRETLLQHLPRHPVIVDLDEEAAVERMQADDVRFTIERVVAMAVVIALLLLAGIMVGLLFVRR